MKTDKHTPTPWTHMGAEIYGADGTRIAEAVTTRDVQLLTDAPELLRCLSALEMLFACSCKDSSQADWIDRSRKLLWKHDSGWRAANPQPVTQCPPQAGELPFEIN